MGTILIIILILLLVGALPSWPLQHRLGLLPERWAGFGAGYYHRSGADGTNLIALTGGSGRLPWKINN